jgi:hypothetical protein
VAHDDDIGFGEWVLKEASRRKGEAAIEAELRGVLLEDGSDLREIESEDLKMRMGKSDLRGGVTLVSLRQRQSM